ncbi:MAG: hypothetical protein Q9M48_15545 [Rhodobacterales bacterium]|nr:hypothetical protein [Rhodobacterales bacterium]
MNKLILALIIGFFVAPMMATTAEAGVISRACMKSPRNAKSAQLCRCIQRVANQTLSGSDRRLAAKFFRKPQLAQDVRQSDRRSHEIFWKKYKAFGVAAKDRCG